MNGTVATSYDVLLLRHESCLFTFSALFFPSVTFYLIRAVDRDEDVRNVLSMYVCGVEWSYPYFKSRTNTVIDSTNDWPLCSQSLVLFIGVSRKFKVGVCVPFYVLVARVCNYRQGFCAIG